MTLELIGTIVFLWIMEEAIYWACMEELELKEKNLLCKGISFRSLDHDKKIAKLESKQRVYRNIQKCIRILIAIVLAFGVVITIF